MHYRVLWDGFGVVGQELYPSTTAVGVEHTRIIVDMARNAKRTGKCQRRTIRRVNYYVTYWAG
jgi:hypothetical protein